MQKLVAGPRGYTGARVYICDACVAITINLMNNLPTDDSPRGRKTSMWGALLHRIRGLIRRGHVQRGGIDSLATCVRP